MSSYHSVLKHAQARMEEAGYGEQSALLYMLELTNKEAHNLYMEFDEEMQPELEELYEEVICRIRRKSDLSSISLDRNSLTGMVLSLRHQNTMSRRRRLRNSTSQKQLSRRF